jgi:predicted HicB family RNase H-like nuclease
MPRVNIEIDEEIHKKAKLLSIFLDISLKDLIIQALGELLKKP